MNFETMKFIYVISNYWLWQEDVDIGWFEGKHGEFPNLYFYHCRCSMPIVLS